MKLNVLDLGIMDYEEAFSLQEKLLNDVQNGSEDQLILLEHPKVITLGINADLTNILMPTENLQKLGYQIIQTRRGSDVTYHGPGQPVGYTIFNIKKTHVINVKKYVFQLEQLFIDLLRNQYQINADRDPINSGVFVGNSKILALGLSVKKGVTMHGFALNVNTNLTDFDVIVPCGLKTRTVTSIKTQINAEIDMNTLKKQVINAFYETFNFER